MKKMIYIALSVMEGIDSRGILDSLEKIDSFEKVVQFQQEKLNSLILHAYRNVPYYRQVIENLHLIQNDEVDLSRFKEIPILTKDIIRHHPSDLVSRDYKSRKTYYNSTGGSTGEPVRLMQDKVYQKWGDANFYYWYKIMLGIDEISAKKVILWGSMRDLLQNKMDWKSRIANWSKNIIFLNGFRMTEHDLKYYIDVINSSEPILLRGYAGSLYELCYYASRKGLKLYSPRIIVSAADMLTPEMRSVIEKCFNTKVYDFYGSREINNLAGECSRGLLHSFSFHNYVEILDQNNNPVNEGEEGRVILTNLHNYSMPLIRYDIGDMATLGPQKCPCGNILPTIKRINGRSVDHLIKEDGSLISPYAFIDEFRRYDWVKEFQVIQLEYKLVKILIVPQGIVPEDEKRSLGDKVLRFLGGDCRVEWEFPAEIPRTAQGKCRYIRSEITRAKLKI
jgi:phenylacetate-CoA ligase